MNNNIFASGSSDCCVKLIDIKKRGSVKNFSAHQSPINVIRFSPDNLHMITAAQDKKIKIFDLRIFKEVTCIASDFSTTDIQFHPNEMLIATACSDKKVRFYDYEKIVSNFGTLNNFETISTSDIS